MKVLGKTEGQMIELKGRDALGDREKHKKLAAEVVGFLNTQGGDLFIGVREDGERAVAIEGIANADEELRRVRDFLIEKIEPSPEPESLRLSVEIADGEGSIILVRVKPGKHRPYAVLNGGRRFTVRIGSRNRPMTREELASAFAGSDPVGGPFEEARKSLLADRDALQRDGKDWYWMGIQPVLPVVLDVQDATLKSFLADPEAIGVTRGARSFHVPFPPQLEQGQLVVYAFPPWVTLDQVVKRTVLRQDGGIRFRVVLQELFHHTRGSLPRVIDPDVLLGVPASLLSLARAVFADRVAPEDRFLVDVALLGVGREEATLFPERWHLPRPGHAGGTFEDDRDLTRIRPLELTFEEIRRSPEECAIRLLREVYEAFGLDEDAIPRPRGYDLSASPKSS